MNTLPAAQNLTILGILSGSTISGRGVLNNGTLLIRDVKILDHPSSTEGEVLISNGTLQIEGNTNIEE